MSKIKKIIIILSIIVVIIIMVLVAISINSEESDFINDDLQDTEDFIYKKETSLQLLDDRMDFYAVREATNKYYSHYMMIFNPEYYAMTYDKDEIKEFENNNITTLYNMLDQEYVKTEAVNIDNIKSKLNNMKPSTINITKIFVSEKTDNISIYVVQGMLRERNNEKISSFEILIKIDSSNGTFSVLPSEYVKENYKAIELGKEIEIEIQETIPKNANNAVNFRIVEEETYVKDLYSHLKSKIQYFTEQLYDTLDEEYKKIGFENIEDFKEYIENYEKEYSGMQLAKYQKILQDNYTQYIFIDKNENYYILKEIAPFQYTVMLDNYTIPTNEFTEEYNKQAEAEKVVLNIKRFFMGIDDKNYGYSYSVLAESFKNNKYPTKNEFVNYVKQNFFEENEIEYINYEKENGVYIYKVKVKDASGNNENEKTLNIILRLKDGTNFEMSFGE